MSTIVNGVDDAVMEPGLDPKLRDYPGLDPRQETRDGMVIDFDVAVKLRDGVTIYTDVYRPAGFDGPLPAMLLWSGYGKHYRWPAPIRSAFTQGADVSDYAPIECQDPLVWCPAGYAIVVPDPRGLNSSEGDVTTWSPQEGIDIHDTIEWIAEQPWSNGKVGMGGASYFAIVQWFAGVTRPPHLAALMPYDGMSDLYRECARHGGIPNYGFVGFWNAQVRASHNRAENWMTAIDLHPFDDEYWASKQPQVERIDIPTYVIASWSDHGIHTRGSLGAFMRLGSKDKWLEVHAALGAGLDDPVVLPRRVDGLPSLGNVVADRLLDVNILARLAGPDGRERVPVVGRGDRDGVDLGVVEDPAEVLDVLRLGAIDGLDDLGGRADDVLVDVADGGDPGLIPELEVRSNVLHPRLRTPMTATRI